MYIFSFLTYDFCQIAELALRSFFYYNKDKQLYLYVIDDKYKEVCNYYRDKPYRDNLQIIDAYNLEFYNRICTYNYKHPFISAKSAQLTLSTFRIFDMIPEDEFVRIDLDAMYLASIDFLFKYKRSMSGMIETDENYHMFNNHLTPNHTPELAINVGIAKYTKSKFNLNNTFTEEMFKRLDADFQNYLIPEQDLFNEIAPLKTGIFETITSPCTERSKWLCVDTKAVHYCGVCKPWVKYSSDVWCERTFCIAASLPLVKKFSDINKYYCEEVHHNYSVSRNCMTNVRSIEQQEFLNAMIRRIEEVEEW